MKAGVEAKKEGEESKGEEANVQDTYQQGIVCMLTCKLCRGDNDSVALMLSYEQMYRNAFALNKVLPDPASKKNACIALSSEMISEIIAVGLKSTNSTEMAIVLLQIAFLLCEQREIFSKDDLQRIMEAVVQFITSSVASSESMEKGTAAVSPRV